jgi:hypothetical protein
MLTHGTWARVLAKENRALMEPFLGAIERTIKTPSVIQADGPKHLLYYAEPDRSSGRLLLVAVKCLPRRFSNGADQNRYRLADKAARRGWGEAWVSSAYFVSGLKRRGEQVWP